MIKKNNNQIMYLIIAVIALIFLYQGGFITDFLGAVIPGAAEITGEQEYYNNNPINIIFEIRDDVGNLKPIDSLFANANIGGTDVIPSITMIEEGRYEISITTILDGILTVKATAKKEGYDDLITIGTFNVLRPVVEIESNIPLDAVSGNNQFSVRTYDSDGKIVDVDELLITIILPTNERVDVGQTRVNEGEYTFSYAYKINGIYYIEVVAKEPGFTDGKKEFPINITGDNISSTRWIWLGLATMIMWVAMIIIRLVKKR